MNEISIGRVLGVLEKYRLSGFTGEISAATKLAILFGENQWNTLGYAVVRVELEDNFGIDIPEDEMDSVQTVGDMARLVERAINRETAQADRRMVGRFLCGMEP